MRILFISTHSYLPQRVGGAEWSTHFLCQGLQKHGDSVGILCDLDNKGWLSLRNRIERKFIGRKFPSDRTMGYPVFRGWGSILGVSEITKTFRAEVIIIVGAAPDPFSLAQEALKTAIPVIYQVRDVAFEKHGGDLRNLSKVRFVANSVFTAERLQKQFGLSSDIILPPVSKSHCVIKSSATKVLLINPDPKKGGLIAIQLAEKRPDIPFIFQESWPDNARLYDLKARAVKAGNVEWRQPVLDIRQVYAQARILLAPVQCEEAWGRVATEAHFSGIPVIGSRIGGFAEAVGPGGLQVPPDAPIDEWLQALESLWDDPVAWQTASLQALKYANRDEILIDNQIQAFRSILKEHLISHQALK